MIVSEQTSMRRHTQSGWRKQIPLAFDPVVNPASESALRAAYERLEFSRRLSFEQAMSIRAFAIVIRNMADAIARRRTSSNATSSAPTTSELADDTFASLSLQPESYYFDADQGDH